MTSGSSLAALSLALLVGANLISLALLQFVVQTEAQQKINRRGANIAAASEQQQQQQLRPTRHLRPSERPAGERRLRSPSRGPDAPKIVPLSALDKYQEGADLRLFCAASAPPSGGRIHFEWRKNNLADELLGAGQADRQRLHVSLVDGDSASVLRLNQLEADDSGNYTCLARNQLGFDTSTVRVNVNVRLKWIKEPPGELTVKAGKSVQLECDAAGQPAPLITWTSLRERQSISSKVLRLDKVHANDSGLYECRAQSQAHLFAAGEEAPASLRKLVRLTVNGK